MSGSGRLARLALGALAVLAVAWGGVAQASSRIKDVVSFEGVRENKLVGYGLVVGLNGTGDSLRNAPFTQQSLQSMLERLGVNTRATTNIDTKDVAAVMVTASLPAFAASGSDIDVTVSAMGDAKSLLGGTLLVTSLQGADGEVYAVAQGTVETGAISASGASGSSITRGVPTAGRIASGGTVEKELGFDFTHMASLRLTLHNPDFTTAERIAAAVNARFPGSATPDNPTIVTLRPPNGSTMVRYLTSVEQLQVDPDHPGQGGHRRGQRRGGDGPGRADIHRRHRPGQPDHIGAGDAPGQPARTPVPGPKPRVVPNTQLKVDEQKGRHLIMLGSGASLSSLVKGLNALGVTPRDMINILQTIKAAGALQADIEVM